MDETPREGPDGDEVPEDVRVVCSRHLRAPEDSPSADRSVRAIRNVLRAAREQFTGKSEEA